jgi:hypothetical protein
LSKLTADHPLEDFVGKMAEDSVGLLLETVGLGKDLVETVLPGIPQILALDGTLLTVMLGIR